MLNNLLDAAGIPLDPEASGFTIGETYYSVTPGRAGFDPLIIRTAYGLWLLRAWGAHSRMVWIPFEFGFSGENLVLKVDTVALLFTGDGCPLDGICYADDRRIINRRRAAELLK